MRKKVKDINIKNWTYYFFNVIIYIENFDPNNIKVDGKSHKNVLVYYIEKLQLLSPSVFKRA